jgi:hypothetical protein
MNQTNSSQELAQRQVQRQWLAELLGRLLARHWLRTHNEQRSSDETCSGAENDPSSPIQQ